jgi:hypothetical protein
VRKTAGVLLVVVLSTATLSGCRDAEPPVPVSRSTVPVTVSDPGVVVLRAIRTGGVGGAGGPGDVPDFSLYADRRVITRGDDGSALSTRLDQTEFDGLIAAASDAGLGKPRRLPEPTSGPVISDTTNLSFVFAPDGKARKTSVEGVEYDGDDRARLDQLYDTLVDSSPSSDQPYETERIALLSEQLVPPEDDPGLPWPLRIRPARQSSYRPTCQLLDPADARTLTDLLDDNPAALLWSHPTGQFQVRPRPLLPDEHDCAALRGVEPV